MCQYLTRKSWDTPTISLVKAYTTVSVVLQAVDLCSLHLLRELKLQNYLNLCSKNPLEGKQFSETGIYFPGPEELPTCSGQSVLLEGPESPEAIRNVISKVLTFHIYCCFGLSGILF